MYSVSLHCMCEYFSIGMGRLATCGSIGTALVASWSPVRPDYSQEQELSLLDSTKCESTSNGQLPQEIAPPPSLLVLLHNHRELYLQGRPYTVHAFQKVVCIVVATV